MEQAGERSADGSPGSSLARLVEIMDRLLSPTGCPWDREQTLESLRPFLIEETYEVLDALARGNPADHCEELGDLLMQIVFQAALRRSEGAFAIDDVIASIADKLVRRHPHVFGDASGVTTSEQVLAQWEQIKAREKAAGQPAPPRLLAGIKPGPALVRAQKLGVKANKVGFDWPDWQGTLAKVREEIDEVAEVIASEDHAARHHEVGDLLLAVVNLARKLGVDAETALVDSTQRFMSRFEYVEDRLADRGKTPHQSTLEEMDALWDEAKLRERVADGRSKSQ